MTIAVANNSNTSTYLFWQTQTNQLAGALSTAVVTTSANGTSAQTAGNAAISGTFSANVLLANTIESNGTLFVGNSTVNVSINATSVKISNSTTSLALLAPTATQISNGQFFLNANGQYSAVTLVSPITIANVQTTGTSTQPIDSWAIASSHAAEYLVNVTDNNANNHYTSRIVVMHDTANPYITEYAQLISNSSVGAFAAAIASGNLNLNFTPLSSNTTVRFTKILI